MPEAAVAASRSRAYQALGHTDVALLFLNYAIDKTLDEPDDLLALRLMLLTNAEKAVEATHEANQLLARKGVSQPVLVVASDAYFQAAETMEGEQKDALLARAMDIASLAIGAPYSPSQGAKDFIVVAHLIRGACLAYFGRITEAVQATTDALKVDPNDLRLQELADRMSQGEQFALPEYALSDALNHSRKALEFELTPAA